MAFFSIEQVAIKGISAAVPQTKVSNLKLEGYSEEETKRLISTIGIENRRIAANGLCASDLCVAAADKLIKDLNWNRNEIDLVLFVTQTPDYTIPGSSLQIIERLGLPASCAGFDINQGCAGYVYGLSLISSFMSASGLKKGLLLVGDTISQLVSPLDKSLVPIFSDAGTATALELDGSAKPIPFNTSSFGQSYNAIMVPEGGARQPFNGHSFDYKTIEPGVQRKGIHLLMQGMNVFTFSIGKVAPHVKELLSQSKQDSAEIDYFVFHQANRLILESIAAKLNINLARVPSSLKNFGNTSGATIPLTIVTELNKAGYIPDSTMLLSGFGVGLSMASAIVNFKGVICSPLIEM